MPRLPDVKKDTAFIPTLIEESDGSTYWFIKKINAIPTTALTKNLTTADKALFPKAVSSFLEF